MRRFGTLWSSWMGRRSRTSREDPLRAATMEPLEPRLLLNGTIALVPPNFLTVGNRWDYSVVLTEVDGEAVHRNGKATRRITGRGAAGGYDTFLYKETSSFDRGDFEQSELIVAGGFLKEVAWRDKDDAQTYSNLLELIPTEIDASWNDRLVGDGAACHGYVIKHPEWQWSGTEQNRLTYLGQETVTTPAGQYDCVKVQVNNAWDENDGSYGTEETVLWIDPDVGIIQEQSYQYDYDAWDGESDSVEYTATLRSTNVQGPCDLVAEISNKGSKLHTTMIPGDAGKANVVIRNIGKGTAKGKVDVTLYLSTDQALDAGDIPIKTVRKALNVKPWKTTSCKVSFVVASDSPTGTYYLLAEVDSAEEIGESREDNNVARTAGHSISHIFGTFGDRKNVTLKLKNDQGVYVQYSLTGGGYGYAVYGDLSQDFDAKFREPNRIVAYDTGAKSVLKIAGSRTADVQVQNGMDIYGPLKSLSAPKTWLMGGTLDIQGPVGSVQLWAARGESLIQVGPPASSKSTVAFRFDHVANASIESQTPIREVRALDWHDNQASPADRIAAPRIGKITIPGNARRGYAGDFGADLATDVLGTVKVKGWFKGVHADIQQSVGGLTVGGMKDSEVRVQVKDAVSGLPDQSSDFELNLNPFGPDPRIQKVTVTGIKGEAHAFVASVLAAPEIHTVKIRDVDGDNGGAQFGLASLQPIKSYQRFEGKKRVASEKNLDLPLYGPGDYDVLIL